VVTVKQHNVFGKRVPLVDLFHISSIFEINISVDTNEFVIKYDKDAPKSMTFRTPASEQIILVRCCLWLRKKKTHINNK